MPESQAFVLNRTQKTCSVYATIAADWVWEELTAAQYNDRRATTEALVDQIAAADSLQLAKRGTLDAALDTLHAKLQQIVALARVKWRNDRAKAPVLSRLTAGGNSRPTKRDEIKALLSAWPNLDATWEPLTGYGLEEFTAERITIEGNDTAVPKVKGFVDHYEDAQDAWRGQAEDLQARLREDSDINAAWYAAATAMFPANTSNGDLIRGQVPTTYDPADEPLPIPATPQGVSAGPGSEAGRIAAVCLPVTYATTYTANVTWEDSGGPQTRTASASSNTVEVENLPTGQLVNVTMTASNATGESSPSTAVSVTVP